MLVAGIGSSYQKPKSNYKKKDNCNNKIDQLAFTGPAEAVKKNLGFLFGIAMMVAVVTFGDWLLLKKDEADMKNPQKAKKMLTELKGEYAKNNKALKAKGLTYIMTEKIKPTFEDSIKAFRRHVLKQAEKLKY